MKPKIIHPQFLQYANLCTDTFWEELFTDLSKGTCPYGTYIDGDLLCCRFKGKQFNFNYKDPSKPVAVLFEELIDLFQSKLSLLSVKDAHQKRQMFKDFLKGEPLSDWKSIRRDDMKDTLIEQYVRDSGFSTHQWKSLKTAFAFKFIQQVDLKDNHIVSIEQFDSDYVYVPNVSVVQCDVAPVNLNTIPLTVLWLKYIL